MILLETDMRIPWERDIYVELVKQHIEEENKKLRERQNARQTLK